MGVYLQLANFDRIFASHQGKIPIILNDVPTFSERDEERLNKLIFTTYSRDLLSNVPSCECGEVSGEYNIDENGVGVYCHSCNTHVKPLFEQNLQPATWIRSPDGVAKLINPMVWVMLRKRFSVSGGFNVIHWLCDTLYSAGTNLPSVVMAVQEIVINGRPIERGYNYFVEHFDAIIAALYELKDFRPKRNKKDVLKRMLERHRDSLFSGHLPVPHSSLLVVEKNDLGTYVDQVTTGIIGAIRTLAGIDTEYRVYSTRVKENRTVRTIDQISRFYESLTSEHLASKEGTFRKHVFATREHFSFRAVISSVTDRHRYDEIYIPWGVATSVFRIHLMNKLTKLGYTPTEGISFINKHAKVYHPLLDQLFKELIQESPNGRGVSCLLNRNPSLQRASIQHVYISQVKTDPNENTVSMSILIVKGFNADFDGDALQLSLSIDQRIEGVLSTLAPHMSAFSLTKPWNFSDNASIPKPVIGTISDWLDEPSANDRDRMDRMQAVLGSAVLA